LRWLCFGPRRVALLAGTVLLSIAPAPAARASLLWTADAERPASEEWASSAAPGGACAVAGPVMTTPNLNVTPSPLPLVGPTASHPRAYHFQVKDGEECYGERSELGQANPENPQLGDRKFYPGQEVWLAFEAYLPDDYQLDAPNGDSTGIMQFKQTGAHNYPAMQLRNGGGHLCFYIDSLRSTLPETPNCDAGAIELGAPAHNAWIKLLFHVYLSGDEAGESPGWVEILGDLQDGDGFRQLMPRVTARTSKLNEEAPGDPALPTQVRIGIYRNPLVNGTEDLYIAGCTAATDRESAETNAFDPAPAVPSSLAPATPAAAKAVATAASAIPSVSAARARALHAASARHRHVWLNARKVARRARSLWRVSGGLAGLRGVAREKVLLEVDRAGRWRVVGVTRTSRAGRFSIALGVSAARSSLRAYLPGIGVSPILALAR
jgi:hypothetical protein